MDHVTINLFGKNYSVPCRLTIMTAMEYSGFQLVKGCGCRNGVCGACTVIYRMSGEKKANICLACQTLVRDGMIITAFPFESSSQKRNAYYALSSPEMLSVLFPELSACKGCDLCTRACPKGIDVQAYIQSVRNGNLAQAADISFPCIMCGACSYGCPAGIPHAEVGMLVRRIQGKRVADTTIIPTGYDEKSLDHLCQCPDEEIRELYNTRVIKE